MCRLLRTTTSRLAHFWRRWCWFINTVQNQHRYVSVFLTPPQSIRQFKTSSQLLLVFEPHQYSRYKNPEDIFMMLMSVWLIYYLCVSLLLLVLVLLPAVSLPSAPRSVNSTDSGEWFIRALWSVRSCEGDGDTAARPPSDPPHPVCSAETEAEL